MNIKEHLASEIMRETASTRRILERITDEHLDWKPHDKSMSVRALASHVVELHHWVALAISKSKFDFHTDYQRLTITSVTELIELLDQGLQSNLDSIASITDEEWNSKWILCAGDTIIQESTKLDAYRFTITNHLVHHRGQLTVYLRLLNIPVPGLYGPSADESH